MLDIILNLSPLILYPALLVGLMILGGIVLLPAMYLSIEGSVNLFHLFIVTILASIIADSIWYLVGSRTGKDRVYSWRFIKKRITEAKKFSAFYTRHGVTMVFLAKFVYGTRLASHILAGMHKVNFLKFLGAIVAGTAIWFWVFYFMIKFLHLGVSGVKDTALKIQLIALIVVSIILFMNWFTGKYIRGSWVKE